MTLNYEKLMGYQIPQTEMSYTLRDTMLYALGVGFGEDPVDENQLRFVYERDLMALPTMATIIAAPHAWIKKADVGSSGKSVHAGISFVLHRPLPVEGRFWSRNSVHEVVDKGPGKAALVTTRREVFEEGDDRPVFDILSTSMLRGDGGFGGSAESANAPRRIPDRPSDVSTDLKVLPQAGLIYRLSGDYNPLHADPEAARRAGFERPILHGLCTFGMAGRALLALVCDYRPERLRSMSARFSRPVYPGCVVRTEVWQEAGSRLVQFRCTVPERNGEVVLDSGEAEIFSPDAAREVT